jgi:hypothetical protein
MSLQLAFSSWIICSIIKESVIQSTNSCIVKRKDPHVQDKGILLRSPHYNITVPGKQSNPIAVN